MTDGATRIYFMPALTLKLVGAVALGLIYEFYYGYGGDTFNYYFKPGIIVANSFWDSPITWLQLILSSGEINPATYLWSSRIFTYGDVPTFFVAKLVGFFGLFTFQSYYAIAMCFAVLSFTGVWALFLSFHKLYPSLHKNFALACLFIPSLWFWGSGILKDPITFSAFGWLTFGAFSIIFHNRVSVWTILICLIATYVLFVVKIYILLCFLAATFALVSSQLLRKIRWRLVKAFVAPMVILIAAIGGYQAVLSVGEGNARYSIESLQYTAESTARWLAYVGESQGGSVYTLGDFDFSFAGILRKAPLAIWTSLFRPHLWEAGNPLMLLSALESLFFLALTGLVLFRIGAVKTIRQLISNPVTLFCLVFCLLFALAIGISTYNFGSLMRYRIPLIPLYLSAIYILLSQTQMVKGR